MQNYALQRVVRNGWNIPKNKVTSFNSMFNNCYRMCDLDMDFSGWCTSNTTAVSNMFVYCNNLIGPLNVSNWDVSNVTSMASCFAHCYKLTKIIGLDTWTPARKCQTVNNMFSTTSSLIQDIDLSNLEIGCGDVTNINVGSCVNDSGLTSLNISGWNLGNSVNGISFSGCRCFKGLIANNTVMPRYTNCTYIFHNTQLEHIYLEGIDFKTIAVQSNNFYQYFFSASSFLKRCEFVNCLFPDSSDFEIDDITANYGYLFYNCLLLEYLDVRDMDFGVFTNVYAHLWAFRSCPRLMHFYPPKNLHKNLNITGDYLLSHESLQRIIANLVDLSGQTSQNIAMGQYNIDKLTQTDIDNIAAKNWTYSAS